MIQWYMDQRYTTAVTARMSGRPSNSARWRRGGRFTCDLACEEAALYKTRGPCDVHYIAPARDVTGRGAHLRGCLTSAERALCRAQSSSPLKAPLGPPRPRAARRRPRRPRAPPAARCRRTRWPAGARARGAEKKLVHGRRHASNAFGATYPAASSPHLCVFSVLSSMMSHFRVTVQ